MKNNNLYFLLFMLILFLFVSCNKNTVIREYNKKHDTRMEYVVYKIDSVGNYYLVYLSKQDSLFKVVSAKNTEHNYCRKITVDSKIDIKLRPLGIYDKVRQNKENLPINYLDFADPCVSFDDSTKICIERNMFDLYLTNDLNGLCK